MCYFDSSAFGFWVQGLGFPSLTSESLTVKPPGRKYIKQKGRPEAQSVNPQTVLGLASLMSLQTP